MIKIFCNINTNKKKKGEIPYETRVTKKSIQKFAHFAELFQMFPFPTDFMTNTFHIFQSNNKILTDMVFEIYFFAIEWKLIFF